MNRLRHSGWQSRTDARVTHGMARGCAGQPARFHGDRMRTFAALALISTLGCAQTTAPEPCRDAPYVEARGPFSRDCGLVPPGGDRDAGATCAAAAYDAGASFVFGEESQWATGHWGSGPKFVVRNWHGRSADGGYFNIFYSEQCASGRVVEYKCASLVRSPDSRFPSCDVERSGEVCDCSGDRLVVPW